MTRKRDAFVPLVRRCLRAEADYWRAFHALAREDRPFRERVEGGRALAFLNRWNQVRFKLVRLHGGRGGRLDRSFLFRDGPEWDGMERSEDGPEPDF